MRITLIEVLAAVIAFVGVITAVLLAFMALGTP
jgi:hypothetical protein